MITKGIRGATTIDENSPQAIKEATLELLDELIKQNSIKKENISHVIFTLTGDLDAVFPAKFAREDLGWDNIALICAKEIDVSFALKMCLRILIVLNCNENFSPKFVYLKGAKSLRS